MKFISVLIILLSFNLSGCATKGVPSKPLYNELSLINFSEFNEVFIKPLVISDDIKIAYNNEEAVDILDKQLYEQLLPVFYSVRPFSVFNPSKADIPLIIQPSVVKMKIIGGLARLFGGVLRGGSYVTLKIEFIDGETNKVIASPLFHQQTNAMGATNHPGRDKKILSWVAKAAAEYALSNY